MTDPARQALQLHVRGLVQGVGFRPFVHRLALRHNLGGWVRNESGEVRIEVEGSPAALERFLEELHRDSPPLARIDALVTHSAAPRGAREFRLIASETFASGRLPVSPDVAICDACSAELFDPANRRYRYPFITCTDCGPRFTVIEHMPYDRERTSMRAFTQCADCQREYESPADRRYHSQTNSCFACGPRLWLEPSPVGTSSEPAPETAAAPGLRDLLDQGAGSRELSDIVLAEAAQRLLRGEILAIRSLGGFHLAVDATNDAAVLRLRQRKVREAKPLAVMVGSPEDARRLAHVTEAEAALLLSPARPIVVIEARAGTSLAPSLSPGLGTVGLFLAYTPFHALLLERVGRPLVMTSGNRSEEPIVTSNHDARSALGGIADALLLHDRDIVARYDDSVVRVARSGRITLRRARGYAPLPLRLPVPAPIPLIAVGPHLKSTFTLAQGESAWVSQHIGDLENLETLQHFNDALNRYRQLFRIEPAIAVRDMHPGYLSTRIAEEMGMERVIAVQHHHAHIAAVAAEHGITRPVVGLAFDGTGYGDDGRVWGAEALVADLAGYRRAGQLRYAPLPGGDLAARRPWRAALGYLSLEPALAPAFDLAFRSVRPAEREVAAAQIERVLNSPQASSMGRLFDAAAAVIGLRQENRYEGQAAMELESLAGHATAEPLPFPLQRRDDRWIMDPLPLLAALGERALAGHDAARLAASFHESVALTAALLAERVCENNQMDTVVLSGGVFQNARLILRVKQLLQERKLDVLLPLELSPNDGAISYGQAAIAAALLVRSP